MFRCVRTLGRLVLPELVPLALVTAVVLYAVGPFLTDRFIASNDTYWYYCLLTDVLHQVRSGVFPVYVGQSHANWNGHPVALLPGYLLTGVAIDLVTGGRLTVVEVQHLTGVWSVWAGALSAYFCLKVLIPAHRWLAALLACLYVCCPALLCLRATHDMFPSLITAPYIPPLLYGLVRGARRADAAAVVCVGGALGALWMSHAAIALWSTTGAAVFLAGQAAFGGRFRQTVRFAVCAGALFVVLSVWFFGTIFAMGLNKSHTFTVKTQEAPTLLPVTGSAYANRVTQYHEWSVPGVYRPLGAEFNPYTDIQLGYTVLGLIAFAAGAAACVRCLELRLFVAWVLCLLLPLHPVPKFLWHYWANLPRPCLVTEDYPIQRFGVILAALSVFAAALAAEWLLSPARGRLVLAFGRAVPGAAPGARRYAVPVRGALNAVLAVLALIGLCYSLSEVEKIRARVQARPSAAPAELLALPENQPLHWCNWITVRDPRTERREIVNVKDPFLYDRLLARDGAPLVTNAEVARRGAPVPFVNGSDPALEITPETGPRPVVRFRIEPGRRYLLTLRTDPRNASATFPVEGDTLCRVHQSPDGPGPQTVVVPVWTSAPHPQEVRVSAVCVPVDRGKPAAVRVEPVSLIGYDPTDLPVRVRSLLPYMATVRTDRSCWLETHRQFVPGYEARVNGERVEPFRSSDGMLVVPLREGENEVELHYRGPLLARAAFVVSALGWLAVVGFVGYRGMRSTSAFATPA